jgi:hypothetical protein
MQGNDPVMADPLDRLEHQALDIANRSVYERGNRRALLWVHAFMGVAAGTQMALWGSAPTIELVVGIWSRLIMAGLGVTGGLLLGYGLASRPRKIPFEVAGLALVGLWDLLMTLGLAYARMLQHDFHPLGIHQDIPVGYVSAYPINVYGGLFALIVIHLWTLRQLTRGPR